MKKHALRIRTRHISEELLAVSRGSKCRTQHPPFVNASVDCFNSLCGILLSVKRDINAQILVAASRSYSRAATSSRNDDFFDWAELSKEIVLSQDLDRV